LRRADSFFPSMKTLELSSKIRHFVMVLRLAHRYRRHRFYDLAKAAKLLARGL
jgi:hypothetical protein